MCMGPPRSKIDGIPDIMLQLPLGSALALFLAVASRVSLCVAQCRALVQNSDRNKTVH